MGRRKGKRAVALREMPEVFAVPVDYEGRHRAVGEHSTHVHQYREYNTMLWAQDGGEPYTGRHRPKA